MTGFAAGTGCKPTGSEMLPDRSHIQYAIGEISAFFDDCTPGGPEIWNSRILCEKPGKGFHIFRMQDRIDFPFHVIRIGSPLGIDVEHDKRIITVMQSDAFCRLQGVVQAVRDGCGGIDSDTNQRMPAAGAEQITVLTVMIRNIQPTAAVKIRSCWNQRFLKGKHACLSCIR